MGRLKTSEVEPLSIPIGFLIELSETRSRRDILEAFARWSRVLLASERVAVLLAGSKGYFERWTAEDGQIVHHKKAFEITTSTVGKIFLEGRAAIVEDLAACGTFDTDFVAKMGFKTALYAPILVGDDVFGMLVASYRERDQNELEEHLILETLGRSLAVYMRLHGQVRKFSEMALRDPLTGLGNRAAFEISAERAFGHWDASGVESTILMIDLDHFKSVNDTFGHAAGDQILKDIAKVLKSFTRGDDSVVRWGGEEFCCLLADCDIEHAMDIAERLRQAIAGHESAHAGQVISVTASIGLASISQGYRSKDEFFKAADFALYQAKEGGRNRVMLAESAAKEETVDQQIDNPKEDSRENACNASPASSL